MGNRRCHWVRDRLPLLAGNDLLGSDRRRVERHLTGCPDCRRHRRALGAALEALHTTGLDSPAPGNAASLWPALERQIRESRRPVPASVFPFPVALAWPRLRLWPALGLGLLAAAGVSLSLSARHRLTNANATIARNTRPIAVPAARLPAPEEAPPPTQMALHSEPAPEPTAPASRYDYDLEHGKPMGPEVADASSKLTH